VVSVNRIKKEKKTELRSSSGGGGGHYASKPRVSNRIKTRKRMGGKGSWGDRKGHSTDVLAKAQAPKNCFKSGRKRVKSTTGYVRNSEDKKEQK